MKCKYIEIPAIAVLFLALIRANLQCESGHQLPSHVKSFHFAVIFFWGLLFHPNFGSGAPWVACLFFGREP